VKEKALLFRALHHAPSLLLLPNAWDVASARIFEEAGFPALATTSAGIAYSLGHPDGQRIAAADMAAVVRRIAAAVRIPVTADMEAGYGDVAATVNAALDAGAVGMNLEDGAERGLLPIAEQAERIRTARSAADARGIPMVINARTDVFLLSDDPSAGPVDEAIRRLNAYREAGADSLFAPGVTDAPRIGALARALKGPLNVLAGKGTPPAGELQALGVARLSIGSGAMRATMALTRRIATELRGAGTYTGLTEATLPYAEANRLLERPRS